MTVSKSRVLNADSTRTVLSGRQRIGISVRSSATLGPEPGYYTYTYQITSERSSGVGVSVFGIAPVPPPDSMTAPDQWMGGYEYEENDRAAVWAVLDTITPPPLDKNLMDWSSPYEIQPNETKTFTLVSRRPPTR